MRRTLFLREVGGRGAEEKHRRTGYSFQHVSAISSYH